MKDASMNADQEESAVVEKKDASTQTEFEKEERPRSTTSDDYNSDATIDLQLESSDGSYTDILELDSDYDGPCYPSQACFGLHVYLHSSRVAKAKSEPKDANDKI